MHLLYCKGLNDRELRIHLSSVLPALLSVNTFLNLVKLHWLGKKNFSQFMQFAKKDDFSRGITVVSAVDNAVLRGLF